MPFSWSQSRAALAVAVLALPLLTMGTDARAATFSQDFEAGLGASESTGGNFSINNTNAQNNGTQMMGHPGTYGDDAYDFYQISNVLVSATSVLTFSFAFTAESHFDTFNVIAALTGALAPPGGLVNPTSGMTYTSSDHDHRPELGLTGLNQVGSGPYSGTATFSLASFADQTIDIRLQFGSDGSVTSSGFVLDNLSISDVNAVPEPASLALLAAGLAGLGMVRRRRKAA